MDWKEDTQIVGAIKMIVEWRKKQLKMKKKMREKLWIMEGSETIFLEIPKLYFAKLSPSFQLQLG